MRLWEKIENNFAIITAIAGIFSSFLSCLIFFTLMEYSPNDIAGMILCTTFFYVILMIIIVSVLGIICVISNRRHLIDILEDQNESIKAENAFLYRVNEELRNRNLDLSKKLDKKAKK